MLLNYGTYKCQGRGRLIQGQLGLSMQTNDLTHCSKGSCDWAWSQHTWASKVSQLGTVLMPSFSATAYERVSLNIWSNQFKIFTMGLWKLPLKNVSGMLHTWELILSTLSYYRDYDHGVHNFLKWMDSWQDIAVGHGGNRKSITIFQQC